MSVWYAERREGLKELKEPAAADRFFKDKHSICPAATNCKSTTEPRGVAWRGAARRDGGQGP